jgi:hypothetical protein
MLKRPTSDLCSPAVHDPPDEMHALLGLKDHAWQSLYHFTVGGAVDDQRLSSEPPYQRQG